MKISKQEADDIVPKHQELASDESDALTVSEIFHETNNSIDDAIICSAILPTTSSNDLQFYSSQAVQYADDCDLSNASDSECDIPPNENHQNQ